MIAFDLPEALSATEPPEARGLARDQVRLLVAGTAVHHASFRDLAHFLEPGDLVVVNDSSTLAAAVDAIRPDHAAGLDHQATIHFATELPDRTWVVEIRPAKAASGSVSDAALGLCSATTQNPAPLGCGVPTSPSRSTYGAIWNGSGGRSPIPISRVAGQFPPTRRSSRGGPAARRCPAPLDRSQRSSSPSW